MSGRSKLALLLVLALATRLGAQALPDIGEAEISDVKLLLLDEKSVSRGTLTAKSAKKAREGKISIEGAILKYTRDDGTLGLTASKLLYSPGASEFEAPSGFEAELPDGGILSVPKGSASISTSKNLSLTATCSGDVHLRIGPAKNSPLDARLPDPVVELAFGAKGRAEVINATGKHGARLLASLSRLPSLGSSKEPALLTLSCSSDVSLAVNQSDATLKLGGRVRGTLDQKQRTFALSCNTLRLKVLVVRSTFEPAELEAEGNADLSAEDFSASAACVLLVENALERTATLTRDARARIWREAESLEIQARERAVLRSHGSAAEALDVELEGSAHLLTTGQQLDAKGQRRADWEIQGERITCSRLSAIGWPTEPQSLYSYEITGRGFAPLLLFSGQGGKGAESLSIFGKGAKGLLWTASADSGATLGDVTVNGPDIFVSAMGPFHLVRDLRKALGLRALEEAPNAAKDPGRVVIRAQESVRLNFLSEGGEAKALYACARKSVEIRQEPAKRDDRELCTLSGGHIDLDVDATRIGAATIEPGDGEVRATIGYDLVQCSSFLITSNAETQLATLGPPGRAILRDSQTLAYLHGALSHLKVVDASMNPDAAWIVFGRESSITNGATKRVFDFASARLVFVRGDFVGPRSGPGAFDDLDELNDSDVSVLYEAKGEHLLGAVELVGNPGANQVLNLTLTLTGTPLLRSRSDGLLATARESIQIDASEMLVRSEGNERQSYLLGSVMRLNGDASILFEQAARFFDEHGRLSGFSYDGQWTLRGAESLELRFSPASVDIQAAQRAVARLGRSTPTWAAFLDRLTAFEAVIDGLPADTKIGADAIRFEIIRALLRECHVSLRRAFEFACMGNDVVSARLRQAALNSEARAFALMGPGYRVTSRGFTEIELLSRKRGVPPLMMQLSALDLEFSALSEITALQGEGPVRISTARYVLSGKRLLRQPDGALTLDGARLTLPVEIGLAVEGVSNISMRSAGGPFGRVRISGRQLRIKAAVLKPLEKK